MAAMTSGETQQFLAILVIWGQDLLASLVLSSTELCQVFFLSSSPSFPCRVPAQYVSSHVHLWFSEQPTTTTTIVYLVLVRQELFVQIYRIIIK